MMKPLIRDGLFIGLHFETAKADFIFGSSALKREALAIQFPKYEFCFLKQVHGHHVVHADAKEVIEADGHFTGRVNQALVIQTADCVPLMLANNSQVCALHSGWRGAASDIVGTAKVFFIEPPEVAVIGPHIQCKSFEIGREVMDQLIASVPQSADVEKLVQNHHDPAKCYFDLRGLLKIQLLQHFPEIQIFSSDENTFTSPAFHSFRRDNARAGRQFSFVVLKP